METAKDIIELIEQLGYAPKDISAMTGISHASISVIKSGQRSGKTSLPALRNMLNTIQSNHVPINNNVVDSTIASIDNVPVVSQNVSNNIPVAPSREIQTYQNNIPVQQQQSRGLAYRQTRQRDTNLTIVPSSDLRMIQLQLAEMKRDYKQLQKQLLKQSQENNHNADSDSYLDLATGIASLANQIIGSYQQKKAIQQERQFMLPSSQQISQQNEYERVEQISPRQTYYSREYNRHVQQSTQNMQRRGIYGVSPLQHQQQEEKLSTWDKIKKALGF